MSTTSFLTLQQELASRARLDLDQADQLTLAKRWLNQSQQEIQSRWDWPWALDRAIVQTVADVTTGTVSVSSGGTTVTGSSTAFAASHIGRYIQFQGSNDWYKITDVAGTTELTIESGYTQTSALSAGTYIIRKVFYSLGSSVEKVMTMRQMVTPAKITIINYRDMDQKRPHAPETSNPLYAVMYGYDSSNNWQFTLEPTPSAVMNLEIRFKKKATDLSADADVPTIPEKWHSTVLLDGALYRAYEWSSDEKLTAKAPYAKKAFNDGIAEMITDCEPESDWSPRMESSESRNNSGDPVRFPESNAWSL